jgi:nucleoid-associated protein YgaU
MFARTLLGKALVRSLALAAAALVVWSVAARPSGAHGPKTVYRVRPSDTLWAIAAARYGGDVRQAVWQIEQANHLAGATIVPGERLVLP